MERKSLPAFNQSRADDARQGIWTIQNVRAAQKRTPQGGFDWRWQGPHGDREWALLVNRLPWLPDLKRAWEVTGDPQYIECLTGILDDWIEANPPPRFLYLNPAWRPLEVARRATESFLPLLKRGADGQFRPLPEPWPNRLVNSLCAHAHYLQHHHAWRGNHLITEMLALLEIAIFLREEPASNQWRKFSQRKLEKALAGQVYPDGTYKELSSHYHRIITQNLRRCRKLTEEWGGWESEDRWKEMEEALWHYLNQTTRPCGKNPLCNDADEEPMAAIVRRDSPRHVSVRPLQTNHFPWAGHTVFRGKTKPLWGFFDAGPMGTDHAHEDYLTFSCSYGNADFLVDNGRYHYRPGPWRRYFAGPRGHNVVLLEGRGARQPGRERKALPKQKAFHQGPENCRAWGGTFFVNRWQRRIADWRREVLFDPQEGWTIEDHLVLWGEHAVTTLWHFHPSCEISELRQGGGVHWLIVNNGIRMTLGLESSGEYVAGEIIKGRELPCPQGWWSPRFNVKEPAPCLQITQMAKRPLVNKWHIRFD